MPWESPCSNQVQLDQVAQGWFSPVWSISSKRWVNNFQLSAVLIAEQSWHGRGGREDHVGEIRPCQNPDVCCGASKTECGEHKDGTADLGNYQVHSWAPVWLLMGKDEWINLNSSAELRWVSQNKMISKQILAFHAYSHTGEKQNLQNPELTKNSTEIGFYWRSWESISCDVSFWFWFLLCFPLYE